MFNLYQSMQARAQQRDYITSSTGNLEMTTTGHDRFCQIRPTSTKRRKKRITHYRRAQSAAEFDSRVLQAANAFASSGPGSPASSSRTASLKHLSSRSSSLEDCERTPLRPESPAINKLPTLARLLSCVSLTSSLNTAAQPAIQQPSANATPTPNRHGRYEYTALEDESSQQERLELERKAQRSAARDKAHASCQAYLRNSTRYALLEHLNDIGSRLDKHWFVVKDSSVKTERLLALVPRNVNSPIKCNEENREAVRELFVALQHPYIYPVLDLDFEELVGNTYMLSVLPLNSKGSLKDLIYRSRWQDDWSLKYGQRSCGLPVSQVQRLGRQILEALLFLRDRGFPPLGHLHSGNIILQNGVARLTGLENTLLGYTSRVHPVIWGRARSDPTAIDTICFGHILFEMSAGYELCTPQPTPSHMLDIQDYPQIQQVLELIFENPSGRYPSIQDISLCEFFRNIDLRELRAMPLPMFQARLTPTLLNLLNDVRLHQKGKRNRRSHSASTCDSPRSEFSPETCERRSSSPVACSSSPVPSLYVTPHASMSVLHDSDDEEADDEQSDFSPAKEHRGLSLHLRQSSSLQTIHSTMMTSCLTRRYLPSPS